jgi:hypothetical protein
MKLDSLKKKFTKERLIDMPLYLVMGLAGALFIRSAEPTPKTYQHVQGAPFPKNRSIETTIHPDSIKYAGTLTIYFNSDNQTQVAKSHDITANLLHLRKTRCYSPEQSKEVYEVMTGAIPEFNAKAIPNLDSLIIRGEYTGKEFKMYSVGIYGKDITLLK